MTFTTRILPKAEWSRLETTNASGLWEQLPNSTCVIVVERDGEIVGSDMLMPVLHVECLWVHPDHRGKTAVARRLWPASQQAARELFGVASFAAVGVTKEVGRLLAHLNATKLDGDHFIVPVGGD